MPRKNKRRKNRWEEGARWGPTQEAVPGRGRVAVGEDESGQGESAPRQPSRHHQYHTPFRHSRFSEQHQQGSIQQRRQCQRGQSSSFEGSYEPGNRTANSRAPLASRIRHNFTYDRRSDPIIPFANARRDSSSSESTAGGSPPYSPQPPSSPGSEDAPPCSYCLETRKAQEELTTHVNHVTTALIQTVTALHLWHVNHSADPSDDMDWQYDSTKVIYYMEGRPGYIIGER